MSDTPGIDGPDIDTPAGPDTGPGPATPAERYLADVRAHLAGLTEDERDDLLDDLAAHLHEAAADDPRPPAEVLGPPDRFAAELMASAGLDDRSGPPGPESRLARLRDRGRRLSDHRWTRATLDFLPELRPAWWVLRGYLAVLGLAVVFGDGDGDLAAFPVPSLGSPVVGLAAVVAAIVLSVRLGRSAGASRTGVRLANGVAVVLGLVAVGHVQAGMDNGFAVDQAAWADDRHLIDQGPGGEVLLSPAGGEPVTNIYAYDGNGELIPDVLLYDQDGRPLDLGDPLVDPVSGLELTTDYPLDANGAQVRNAYPREQRTVEWDERGMPRERAVPPPAVVVPPPSTTTTTAPATTTTTTTTEPPTTTTTP